MNSINSALSTSPLTLIFGGASAVLLGAVATNLHRNIGLSVRGAFWLLFAIGFITCALGPLGRGAQVGWWNPRHITGYVLGSVALLLGAAVLFNWSLPLISTPRAALFALGALMAAKMVVALLYPRLG